MSSNHQVPQWLNQATFYEIYPQSFADSNADGIGDITGIIEHLDYLLQLGCNAIWLNPLYESPFRDAGYDISDYTKVAARYGTNDDLASLFEAAHARGMHVLLDLVPGHTSNEHPSFRQSATDSANLYDDRYIWTDNWIEGGDGLPFIGGTEARNGAYIVNFFAFQPALNYGFAHPRKGWQAPALGDEALRTCDAMLDVMRFWLDMGADGFRVDMADSLVKGDDDGKPYTIRTWQYMFGQLRGEYPEAAFVSNGDAPTRRSKPASTWTSTSTGAGMVWPTAATCCCATPTPHAPRRRPQLFQRGFRNQHRAVPQEYEPRLEAARQAQAYFDLITCNHDTARLVPRLSTRELALAYSTIFLMPGVPFIYYGDEIGMRYRDLPSKEGGYTRTGSRTPMQWDSSRNHGFSQAAADALYLPVDEREEHRPWRRPSPTATRSGIMCTQPSNSAEAPRPSNRMRTSACCSPRRASVPSCSSARKTASRPSWRSIRAVTARPWCCRTATAPRRAPSR